MRFDHDEFLPPFVKLSTSPYCTNIGSQYNGTHNNDNTQHGARYNSTERTTLPLAGKSWRTHLSTIYVHNARPIDSAHFAQPMSHNSTYTSPSLVHLCNDRLAEHSSLYVAMPNTSFNIETTKVKPAKKSSESAPTCVQCAPTALTPEQESAVKSCYLILADQERLQFINVSHNNGSTTSYKHKSSKWVAPTHFSRHPKALTIRRRTRLKTISPTGSRFPQSFHATETLYLPPTKGLRRRNALVPTGTAIKSRARPTIKSPHPTHSRSRPEPPKASTATRGVSLKPPWNELSTNQCLLSRIRMTLLEIWPKQ